MQTIVWDESFSVGVSEIDAQHKELVKMINDLASSAEGHEGCVESCANTLAAMSEYAATHFATEESLLAAHGFPKLDQHRAEHLAFRTQIVYLSDEVASHGATVPFEVHDRLCRYLCDWLRKHILYTDMRYSAFFDERGVC